MFTMNQAKSVAVVLVMFWMTTLSQAAITGTMAWADTTNTTPVEKITTTPTSGCWNLTHWDNPEVTSLWANSTTDNTPASPLVTTVTGLDNTKTYEVFVQYIGTPSPAWMIAAALAGGTPVLYWSDNGVDTGIRGQPIPDAFWVYEHSLGTVSGVTSFGVDISQPFFDSAANYCGVSYQVVPEPAALSLLLLGGALAMRRRS